MAFALVGSVGTVASSTSSTCQPSFAQATTAGNLLIGIWWHMATGATAPTLDQGWSFAIQSSGSGAISSGYKANCGASETAPTLTLTGNGQQVWGQLFEFSGGDTVSPLDLNKQSYNDPSTPAATNATGNDAAAGELMMGYMGTLLSKAGTDTTTLSFNNGTMVAAANNDASSVTSHYRSGYLLSTTSNAGPVMTATDTSMNLTNINVGQASYKVAAAVAQPRNAGVNFQDPALFMEGMEQNKRNHLWLPKRRAWRPKLWTPGGELCPA